VLDLRGRWLSAARTAESEELREARRQSLGKLLLLAIGGFLLGGARGYFDVDDGRGDARGDSFHGVVERGESGDAVIGDWRGGFGSGMDAAVANKERGSENKGSGNSGRQGDLLSLSY
jgi:hypothetical protein